MARGTDPSLTKDSEWEQRLRRYQTVAGRQSIATFCEAEDCSEAMFYYWRKKLGHGKRRKVSMARRKTPKKTSVFRPVTLASSGSVSVELPNGLRLSIPADKDGLVCDVVERLAGVQFVSGE